MTCTFFGHRDAPSDICAKLQEVLCDVIVSYVTHSFGGAAQFKELAKKGQDSN